MTTDPKIRRRVWAEIIALALLGIAVAIVGEPQPLAIVTAGAVAVTILYIGAKELDR